MQIRRPSRLWFIAAGVCAALSVAAALTAYQIQRQADRPVGEGELFVREAEYALGVANSAEPEDFVREIRNSLHIEAVSFVAPNGIVTASTSPTLVGAALDDAVLASGLQSGSFIAVASAVSQPITIDDVEEWAAGDVLYRVLQPTSGGAVLLDYDIAELPERRSQGTGVTETTVRLGLLSGVLTLFAAAALIGRGRTVRHNRDVAREADLLRRHARELEVSNEQLDKARANAEQALELAEETNRVRAEFVLMINHELRTPLTTVVTGADLLRSDRDMVPEAQQEILDAMVSDGRRLADMIDQMLVVARIENRGLNVEFAAMVTEDVCSAVAASHTEVTHEHPAVEATAAWADRSTLTHLLHSLIDNARAHGASQVRLVCGTEVPFEPQIEVGTRPRRGITFVVVDNGPGIDHSFLRRIFEKFEKNSVSSGTGLGLYLAKMMVEAMNGSIAVSTSPRGTSMAVTVQAAVLVRNREGQS